MTERFRIVALRAPVVAWMLVAPVALALSVSILLVRFAPGSDGFRLALGMLLPVPLWVAATCVSVVDGTSERFILATALASALAALT